MMVMMMVCAVVHAPPNWTKAWPCPWWWWWWWSVLWSMLLWTGPKPDHVLCVCMCKSVCLQVIGARASSSMACVAHLGSSNGINGLERVCVLWILGPQSLFVWSRWPCALPMVLGFHSGRWWHSWEHRTLVVFLSMSALRATAASDACLNIGCKKQISNRRTCDHRVAIITYAL